MAMTDAERKRKQRAKEKTDRTGCTPYEAIRFRAKRYVWLGSPRPVASDFTKPFKGDIERAIKEAEKRKGNRNEIATADSVDARDLRIIKVLTMCRDSIIDLDDGGSDRTEKTLYHVEKLMEEMNQREEKK